MLKWVLKKILPLIAAKLIDWILSLVSKKEEDKKPIDETPKKDLPPKQEPPAEVEKPKEPEKPRLPEYSNEDFIVPVSTNFFCYVERFDFEPNTILKHKEGHMYLINPRFGDLLYIDEYKLQTVGNARLTLNLNAKGKRYFSVRRNNLVVASLSVSVI